MPTVKLSVNVPVTLSLLSLESEIDQYDKVHYSTNGGDLVLSNATATQLNLLELRIGEQFTICKYQESAGVRYVVSLAGSTENHRAQEEIDNDIPPSELEETVRRSIDRAQKGKPSFEVIPAKKKGPKRADPDQPRLFDRRGTGTEGPAPAPVVQPRIQPAPPQPIHFQTALRMAVSSVVEVLRDCKEQWTAEAKQDLVSTVYIDLTKKVRVNYEIPTPEAKR